MQIFEHPSSSVAGPLIKPLSIPHVLSWISNVDADHKSPPLFRRVAKQSKARARSTPHGIRKILLFAIEMCNIITLGSRLQHIARCPSFLLSLWSFIVAVILINVFNVFARTALGRFSRMTLSTIFFFFFFWWGVLLAGIYSLFY